jgi:hypothetical protein
MSPHGSPLTTVIPSLLCDILQLKPKISQNLFVTSFQVCSLVRCDAVIRYVPYVVSGEPARSIIYAGRISQPISNITSLPRF